RRGQVANCGLRGASPAGIRSRQAAEEAVRLDLGGRAGNGNAARPMRGCAGCPTSRRESEPAPFHDPGRRTAKLPPASGGDACRRLNARLHESGRPGSNRRRPAWQAFAALAGQGLFGGGRTNGITQYRSAPPTSAGSRTVSTRAQDRWTGPHDLSGRHAYDAGGSLRTLSSLPALATRPPRWPRICDLGLPGDSHWRTAMNPTLQAIIKARATPWVLLAMTLTATAFALVGSRRKAFASPQLLELSVKIHDRGRDYVRGLELIVSGDPVMGNNLLASATDRMTVLAEECVRTDGCDIDIF